MTIKGEVKLSNLEGGLVLFTTEAGKRYQVDNLWQRFQVDGLRLELEGAEKSTAVGIGMMAPIFHVSSVQKL